MATSPVAATRTTDGPNHHRGVVRRTTETKAAFKTTELIAYVVVTILTVGYMVSRGLAKSGSRDPYTEDNNRH